MNEKARIRKAVLARRDSIDPGTRRTKDSFIKERFFSLSGFRRAEIIFCFASFRSEVSTFPLIEESLRLGKRVILPSVDSAKKELRLFEIEGLNELSPGYMGIPEPHASGERERDINDADLIVMPGAAFDPKGNRLGYGAGYYDKLLSGLKKKIPLLALAYEEQIVDTLPAEPHDVRVDVIVTDRRVIDCAKMRP